MVTIWCGCVKFWVFIGEIGRSKSVVFWRWIMLWHTPDATAENISENSSRLQPSIHALCSSTDALLE